MRIATIDIGTNTILMLVADISPGGILSTIRDEHSIPRLGEGVDATHLISQTALKRAVEQLRRYRLIAQDENAEMVVACGTSALRDAKNRDDVIDLMGKKTGIRVEVLSGEQEAELTYLGAVSDYLQGDEPLAVLDIGGGSTELTFGNGKTITHRRSLDVGSVRLTERILKTSPPTLQAIEDSRSSDSHIRCQQSGRACFDVKPYRRTFSNVERQDSGRVARNAADRTWAGRCFVGWSIDSDRNDGTSRRRSTYGECEGITLRDCAERVGKESE
jgi:hypothetical protein